jgi:hypothetical protein
VLHAAAVDRTLVLTEAITSKELTELEATLLYHRLIRREKLLATMQKGNWKSQWRSYAFLLFNGIVAYVLVRQAFNQDEVLALLMIMGMTMTIDATYVASVESRADALVKLLQEDGMLQGTPAVSKHAGEP